MDKPATTSRVETIIGHVAMTIFIGVLIWGCILLTQLNNKDDHYTENFMNIIALEAEMTEIYLVLEDFDNMNQEVEHLEAMLELFQIKIDNLDTIMFLIEEVVVIEYVEVIEYIEAIEYIEVIEYVEIDISDVHKTYYKDMIDLYEDALDEVWQVIEDLYHDYESRIDLGESLTAEEVVEYLILIELVNKLEGEYSDRYDEIKQAYRDATN